MRITLEQFTYGMGLLASVHGDDHPVYKNPDIAEIWFKFFATKFSNDKFLQMVKHHLSVCHWFPKVPNDICKVWEESGDERRPGENWLMNQQQTLMALRSQEAQEQVREMQEAENMSLEKMAENRKRMDLMLLISKNIKSFQVEDVKEKIQYLAIAPLHEVEAIARTCQKAKELSVKADNYGNLKVSLNALFEDMRKYFHSGSQKYRQVAIDWASDSRNGCKLVKKGAEVVDIEQVEF